MQDLLQTQDGATYMAERIWISLHYPLEGTHPLTGYSAPNFAFEDGSTLADWTHDEEILLDFENNTSFKKLGINIISIALYLNKATEQFGLKALLIRPDGIVAWAMGKEVDKEEVRRGNREMVCNLRFDQFSVKFDNKVYTHNSQLIIQVLILISTLKLLFQ
jgi:hypothetical protein